MVQWLVRPFRDVRGTGVIIGTEQSAASRARTARAVVAAESSARRRVAYRPTLRHRRLRGSLCMLHPTARRVAVLSPAEQERRVRRVTAYLVRTIRTCPAPGVAPFTLGDWLMIGAILVPSFVLVYVLTSTSGGR